VLIKTAEQVYVPPIPAQAYQPYSKTCPTPPPNPGTLQWLQGCGTLTSYISSQQARMADGTLKTCTYTFSSLVYLASTVTGMVETTVIIGMPDLSSASYFGPGYVITDPGYTLQTGVTPNYCIEYLGYG